MNQYVLINILASRYGFPKILCDRIIKTILNAIVLDLKKGNPVRLRNFGTFSTRMSYGKTRAKFNASKNIFKHYGKEEGKNKSQTTPERQR